jgi:ankyrin repeat protein
MSYMKNGWTSLHYASAKQAPLKVVQLLIEKGADVNASTKVSHIPL